MTVKLFNTLFDEVLIDVPGVLQNVALNAIRNAAIEFCEHTRCWVVDAEPITSIANQAVYQFDPDSGTEIAGVIQAYYNGVRIDPMTAEQLDSECSQPQSTFVAGTPWSEQAGTPKYYHIERPDEFILVPYPDTGIAAAIKMKIALKPSRSASGMEKWLIDKHFEEIAHGAKGKLCAMQKKPWSDATKAVYHMREFNFGINKASAHSSHKLPVMVVAPAPI